MTDGNRHPFVWYELLTSDPEAAEAFYTGLLGWTLRDAGMKEMRYSLVSVGDGAPIAGIMGGAACVTPPAQEGAQSSVGQQPPPGWVGYVGTAQVDASAQQLVQAGGAVLFGPQDIPGVGRFAMMRDPQGAVFALFHGLPGDRPPALGTEPLPGHVAWHELHAVDGVSAFDFYAAQFGWTKDAAIDMGPMGIYQLFAIDGVSRGGMMTKMPEAPQPYWLFYFSVPDIQAAAERVKATGGRLLLGPQQVPGGSWILNAMDPQGALFGLTAPA
ncbi:VOC family protein [Roseateles koreensis]|uniref:VOC family protein n=1 Tax=Roseateles koreensis TaxID=2987526 RepID=A0ABT5KXL8_9BURK|nr:VOC family protein [Roseateles koreensis]MDC8786576.1 VOC family protein [Roseateles koreensis]